MKMKYMVAILLATTVLATSCGDDDHPYIPEKKKITGISCKQEGTDYSWDMKIKYDQDGNLYRVTYASSLAKDTTVDAPDFSELYQYNGNTITVTRFIETIPDINRTYTCSGSIITREEEGTISEALSNIYQYTYRGKELTAATQTTQTPSTGTTTIPYNFTWDNNGNMTEFTYNNTTRLQFTYGAEVHPENFPLKALKSVDLTDRRFLDPINLLYNATPRNLPVEAKIIILPAGTITTTYTFKYNTIGEYITGMTMSVTGPSQVTRTYTYIFTYDYDPNIQNN
ncbi:DUF5032 domain-containing protein [Parabacteroides pacaensis]|uniref:DUF5032 domain-containing protein n=1 Tax=Parabacteroides pacaensis TaxID=2086575 RepID=UPI000D0F8407|nr:DUF5032 domain-containing protein [Parabacteroides pacaensis]